MTALRKILIEEEPVVAATVTRAPAPKLYVVTGNAPEETRATALKEAGNGLKNVALFLVAPFIGLVYAITLPFVGLAVLATLAGRVVAKFDAVKVAGRVLKDGGLAIAAPFIGLAYVVFFPFIGLGALAWLGGRAALAAAAR
jgi:hypothetical protein